MLWHRALQEIFRTQLGLRNTLRSLLELLQHGDKDETVITTKIVVISSQCYQHVAYFIAHLTAYIVTSIELLLQRQQIDNDQRCRASLFLSLCN